MAIDDPTIIVQHSHFGTVNKFSFEIDNEYFMRNYIVSILGEIARQVADKYVKENYPEIAKNIDAKKISDTVAVEAVRVALKKWGES